MCELAGRPPGWGGAAAGRGRCGSAFSSPALQPRAWAPARSPQAPALRPIRLAGSSAVAGCVQVARRPGLSSSWPPLGLSVLISEQACHLLSGDLKQMELQQPEGTAAPQSLGWRCAVWGPGPSPWDPGKTGCDRGRRPRLNWEAFAFPPRPPLGPGLRERACLSLGAGQRAGRGGILVW